jgi:hypothetical protein
VPGCAALKQGVFAWTKWTSAPVTIKEEESDMTLEATGNGSEVARPLTVLAPLIREEIKAGEAAGMENYRRAGEMLIEARERVNYGEWRSWVKRNFHLSYRQAMKYVKLARESKGATSRFSSLREFEGRPSRSPIPPWAEAAKPVVNQVNVEAQARENQSRAQEQQLVRTLRLQLIDIGYRSLSVKLHPDKGGSNEAMARLNRVRDMLKNAVETAPRRG